MKQYAEFVQTYDLTKEINSKVEDLHSEMSSINERIQVGSLTCSYSLCWHGGD